MGGEWRFRENAW